MLAEQIQAGIDLRRRRFVAAQPQLTGEHHQVRLNLDPSEEFADAIPRSSAKWSRAAFEGY
jgi:hypothetical protein